MRASVSIRFLTAVRNMLLALWVEIPATNEHHPALGEAIAGISYILTNPDKYGVK
jgi:hypothetical protein